MERHHRSGFKRYLGEILVEKGLLSKENLAHALKLQVGGNRRLGYLLIRMGLIGQDDLMNALSDQLNIPVINIKDRFQADARVVFPRYLCKKYSVVPLSREEHNVLRVAMIDPLDDGAIADIERYTGMAVEPLLAGNEDISRSIRRLIPLTAKDVFNPMVFTRTAKTLLAAAMVLTVAAGFFLWRITWQERYGLATKTPESTIYKNHDLMVDLSRDGKIFFLGRGAYTAGYYGVKFDNARMLADFIATQEKQLSEKQRQWLKWVLETKCRYTR